MLQNCMHIYLPGFYRPKIDSPNSGSGVTSGGADSVIVRSVREEARHHIQAHTMSSCVSQTLAS